MITVIVPVHNTKKYIGECLESIINQSFKNIEILLIDSSTDNTRQIIDKYLEKDERITYFYNKNNSYGFKVNYGIKKAKGEYISIVDSDDYIHKDFYKNAIFQFKNKTIDFVKYDFNKIQSKINNKKNIKYTYSLGNKSIYNIICNSKKYPEILYSNCTSIGSGVYSKSFINKYRIKLQESPGASFQDTSFYVLTHLFAKSIKYINKAFYYYRIDNAQSSIHNKANISSIIDEHKYIEKKLKNRRLSNKLNKALIYKEIMDYSWNYNRLNGINQNLFIKMINKRINNIKLNSDSPSIIIKKYNELNENSK